VRDIEYSRALLPQKQEIVFSPDPGAFGKVTTPQCEQLACIKGIIAKYFWKVKSNRY
jgi:hypothetical protein